MAGLRHLTPIFTAGLHCRHRRRPTIAALLHSPVPNAAPTSPAPPPPPHLHRWSPAPPPHDHRRSPPLPPHNHRRSPFPYPHHRPHLNYIASPPHERLLLCSPLVATESSSSFLQTNCSICCGKGGGHIP